MGYRYKHGGWHDRLYRATVMIDGKPHFVTYSSCFGLNMWMNFTYLQDRCRVLFGVKIHKQDVIDRKLLSVWEEQWKN